MGDLNRAELGLGEAVRDLDVDRETDAEHARVAGLTAALLPGWGACIVGGFEREVESPRIVASVVLRPDSRREGEVVPPDEVAPPHLGRVKPDLGGESVDRTLDHLRRL